MYLNGLHEELDFEL